MSIVGSELSFTGTPFVVIPENLLALRLRGYDRELHHPGLRRTIRDFGGLTAQGAGPPIGAGPPTRLRHGASRTVARRGTRNRMPVILVVDDERPVREFLVQALEEDGYRVLQAVNGRHALNVISKAGPDGPDLIISDVMMPLVGGLELCRTIKGNPNTAEIAVVLMSAAAAETVTAGAHADAFLAKPFDLDTMAVLIHSVLADQRTRPD
jgi:CheY-like chemotaxis protein